MAMQNNAAHFLVDRHVEAGNASRVAIVGTAGEVTYGELATLVDQAAHHLLRLQVAAEQRVVLQLPDSVELVAFFFAALKIGAVAVPVNTFCSNEVLSFYLKDTRAPVLVTHSSLCRSSDATSTVGPFLKCKIFADWSDWKRTHVPIKPYDVAEDDSAFWLYTSGSTGTQKGVIHRHAGILACVRGYCQDVLGLTAVDRCYSASKSFFAYGLGNSVLFPLSVGATSVLSPLRSEPEYVIKHLREYRPTLFFAVPTLYQQLLASPQFDRELFSGVRMCISAGEALPEALYSKWQERTGQQLYDGIGSTEAMHIFCSNRPGQSRAGSSGVPVQGYELRIVDGGGVPVKAGEAGQLLVRGKTFAKGYWNREEATRTSFRGEWLATGDIYRQDADGYFYYLGRQDDVFKSSGMWISPGEIEQALLSHPCVREAAVVGVGNDSGLTSAKAFVVLDDAAGMIDEDSTRAAIIAHLRKGLSKYKVPAAIDFLPALPRTATGKISRAELRRLQSAAREPATLP